MTAEPDINATFFADLPSFDDFNLCTDPAQYRSLPAGWHIAVTDIQNSTDAITEGRYKDVNMTGAACITAVLNAAKKADPTAELPFSFGGDGATMAVPAHIVEPARKALAETKSLCKARFGFQMRAAIMPAADFRAMGLDVQVAKFQLSPGNHLAFFNGGGCAFANALVKDRDIAPRYRIADAPANAFPDLEGLTCRWSLVGARTGRIATVMLRVNDEAPATRTQIYNHVLTRLRRALKSNLTDCAPASDEALTFRWPPKAILTEARTTAGPGFVPITRRIGFILMQSAIQWILHRTNGKAGGYNAPVYKREMIANTDFRRFDDTLRLVLDCSEEQVKALKECLDALQIAGDITYGMHLSEAALMTCLVFDLGKSSHVHFIDGDQGGFALAAQELKHAAARTG